jgi:hypothetical protein
MQKYTFTLKHDNGFQIIKTIAKNIDSAIKTACAVENCPELAIVAIHIKPIK